MNLRVTAAGLLAVAALFLAGGSQAQTKPALTPAAIDHQIRAQWAAGKIVPAPPVDDARFLRRVFLDITGTIPPSEVVRSFLADKSPDKRAHAIDALLDSPRYADHWTDYWDNVLMGQQVRSQVVDRGAFRRWLHSEFVRNAAWNKFVYDLITASGQNSVGGTYRPNAPMMSDDNAASTADAANVNGAVDWILKYQGNPQDLSGTASKLFLGVQIQCAQCHDHKTEKWKQEDFRSFTACFINARPKPIDTGMVKGTIRRVDLEDVNRPFLGRPKVAKDNQQYAVAKPAALDHTDFSDSPNRRQALAAWMTAPQNPWFAEAIVNRMWNHFLGRGFIEPIDDIRPSNPAVMPDLLKALSDDFVANNYDLKHLIKTICATQVYQVSSSAAKSNDPDNKYWARFRLKPMGPDELMDSLVTATNLQNVLQQVAGANTDVLKFQLRRQFSFLFDVDEEFEQKDFEGTIPQALMLLNGTLVNKAITAIPGTALADLDTLPGDDRPKVEELYMRTLSRKPTASEMAYWVDFVNQERSVVTTAADTPPDPQPLRRRGKMAQKLQGKKNNSAPPDPLNRLGNRFDYSGHTAKGQAYEDMFWALLNSSEFIFNH